MPLVPYQLLTLHTAGADGMSLVFQIFGQKHIYKESEKIYLVRVMDKKSVGHQSN